MGVGSTGRSIAAAVCRWRTRATSCLASAASLTGDAKITVAGNLPCSKVIHAVGPAFGYSSEFADHEGGLELLESTLF